jgi:UDP-N-acetylmuramate: L-alanyl-gamma-D-glutamyl-meso-diaminopimelate ligase
MHVHILGICGTFMGGVAAIAAEAGHRVTGCDANVYPPMSTQLQAQGIALIEGYDARQVEIEPDLWMIGNVIARGNPLLEAILDRGDPISSGPQWLAENILAGKQVLAVAGTHGKTTVSSLLAWILEHAGLNPGFLIGGVPDNFGISARMGKGSAFVIEADEYDTAYFDKRSKFVHYRPRVAILNNLEYDHADIFPDLAAIELQFHHLIRTIPASGTVVSNGVDAALERVLARGCWSHVERFSVPAGWHLADEDGYSFAIIRGDRSIGHVKWPLLGAHNRMNALAAVAAADAAGVDPAKALEAMADFQNVKRRMEVRGVTSGVIVYDDFAHHPTAIAATLQGLREKVGTSRILAVLEPRSNTMKLGVMKEKLADSLRLADQVFCYSAKLGWDARTALASLGARAHVQEDFEELLEAIVSEAAAGDHVLVMSNGGFGGIHQRLLQRLGERGAVARPGVRRGR